MNYAEIEEEIPFKIGQKVKVKHHVSEKEYVGNITRIDTFHPNTYNLHVKILMSHDINGRAIYSEAVVYPQPAYTYSTTYRFIGIVDED